MQSNIIQRAVWSSVLTKPTAIGHVYQVRNHVKIYPWRRFRNVPECYLDNSRTPYTDKHNINEFKFTKKSLKPWMKVTYKDKESRFNRYHWNDAYTSDPVEAKETATSRLKRFQDSLRDRGEARERKPYSPPPDVREQIISIYKSSISSMDSGAKLPSSNELTNPPDVLNIDLDQSRRLKFNLISKCISTFDHDVPSSFLNDMKTIGDVVDYFSIEVRGVNPFDSLVSKKELPPNLTFLSEPQRYNKETDTYFRNTALPGIISKVPGLRASKKYPILNQHEFQWPDI